jgi:hypothetical protein
MKTLFNFFFYLCITLASYADNVVENSFVKEKNISKSYAVNPDGLVQISNSYGNIYLTLWDENKVSIQITIKVTGNNEKKVVEKMNSIDVVFDASSSKVSAITTFENTRNSSNNINYEINYTVKIPRNGSISLTNKYGNIEVPKLNGTSNIVCQYGDVNFGDFKNKTNTIKLSYSSNSTFESFDKMNLNCQYSHLTFQNINHIDIDGNYNTFNFQNVETLSIATNYSKIYSKSIQKFTCNGNYLTLKLGEIGNRLQINSNYSEINLASATQTKVISINGNYSNTKIICQPDIAFDFLVNLKYGNFKENLGVTYTEKAEKNASKSLTGYHINQGKTNITVNTNYGSLQLLKQ